MSKLDKYKAQRVINFFEKGLIHYQGKFAGKPFLLMNWQKELLTELFGRVNQDGQRQYRTCYVEIPKKNGKSPLAAGVALYCMLGDGEPGAQVYCAATSHKQASIVFETAKQFCRFSPILASEVLRRQYDLYHKKTASEFKILASDSHKIDGLNASCIVIDEMHQAKSRDMFDTLKYAGSARDEPLLFIITTAGNNTNSICYELHEYALKVKAKPEIDPTFLPVIYAADKEDDPFDKTTWEKANPSLGVTINKQEFTQAAKTAKEVPSNLNSFKRFRLNIWTEHSESWLPLNIWERNNKPVDPQKLVNKECWAGLDLSLIYDLTALVLLFKVDDHYEVLPYFFLPQENMEEREHRDNVPYLDWINEGYIIQTPGRTTDYRIIRETINELATQYNIKELAYDPYMSGKLIPELESDGLICVPVQQSFRKLTDPIRELERLLVEGQMHHGNNPILKWNAENVRLIHGQNETVKLDKAGKHKRIDGIAAIVNALQRASLFNATNTNQSWVYSDEQFMKELLP